MKNLVDICYQDADVLRLLVDNLNIHTPSALYEVFPPEEARRIIQKLEFHYTPKHASWLNQVELELSVLSRQCLELRISNAETLTSEIAAWEKQLISKKLVSIGVSKPKILAEKCSVCIQIQPSKVAFADY